MPLATIVARNRSGTYPGPGLRRVVHQNGVVGNSPQVIVDIVTRTERVVVAAIAGKLLVFVNQKVSHIQMLVRGESVWALEEKVGGIFVPRTASVDIARPGTDV